MTITDPDVDRARLRALVDQLDALLGPGVDPQLAANPDGTPGNVAAGELIESAWGNATANTIGKLKSAQRYQAALSFPATVVDTSGGWISGNVTIPSAPYRRLAVITVGALVSSLGEVDLVLYGVGAVMMRKVRGPAAGGNGTSFTLSSMHSIGAGSSEQYALKLAAIAATVQVGLAGGSEFNYLDVIVVPTLTT
jgi:hypothetical protein